MPIPLLAAGAGLLAVPVLAVSVFFGSGAAEPTPTGSTCTVVVDPAGAPTAGPSGTGNVQVSGDQVANARTILAATKALGLPQQAGAMAIMTAYQESKLLVLANPKVPESLTFLQSLQAVLGWLSLPAWQAAQAVQASADGTQYAQWTDPSTAITAALWDGATGTLQCTAGGTAVTGPGGAFPPEACSVRPDPTSGRGCLTPRTLNIAVQLMAQGWRLSCWDAHAWNPSSDHPKGKACDAFPGRGGVLPTPEQKAHGDALAASLQASAAETGVKYLIWYGRWWKTGDPADAWNPYNGGGVYDPASITGGHYDHVHVSVF